MIVALAGSRPEGGWLLQHKKVLEATWRWLVPRKLRNSLRLWFLFDLPDRRPEPLREFTREPVVVLAPHMDDEAIGCGGALVKHSQAGAEITAVYMTDGRQGGYNADNTLVARRKAESQKSADILGIRNLVFLDGPDLNLTDTPALVQRTADILLDQKPAVVYSPALTDRHPDHWGTNAILNSALALLPKALLETMTIRGYEVWSPLPANRLLDITAEFPRKRDAVSQFVSQLSFDYVTAVTGLNQYRALTWQKGNGYAEAYLDMTPAEYRRMFAALLVREPVAKVRTARSEDQS
jgi:LmbE family N-acetylglucosaminyl deacetylase